MKKINVFDSYANIKDSEKYGTFTREMIEKLDEMLDQYEIDHAFSLCRNEDIEADIMNSVTVMYNSEDDTKFNLVYALFLIQYRKVESEFIKKTMLKAFGK